MQASEPDMSGMLEFSEQKFKTTMTEMLKTLMDKVENMQEQMGHGSREMEILRKNQKKYARDQKH